MSVLNDIVGDTHGHNVCQSLDLVDDGIRVGHLDPVFHTWDPVGSNHLVDLLMDLGWKRQETRQGGQEELLFANAMKLRVSSK